MTTIRSVNLVYQQLYRYKSISSIFVPFVVIIPSDIQLRQPRKSLAAEKEKTADADLEFSETLSVTSDEPKSKDEPDADSVASESGGERSKLAKA